MPIDESVPKRASAMFVQPCQVVLQGGVQAARQTLPGMTPGPTDVRLNPSGTSNFHMNAQCWSTASRKDCKISGLLREMTSKSHERL